MYHYIPHVHDTVASATLDTMLQRPEIGIAAARDFLRRHDPFLYNSQFLHFQNHNTIKRIFRAEPEKIIQTHPRLRTAASRLRPPQRRGELFTIGRAYLLLSLREQMAKDNTIMALPKLTLDIWDDASTNSKPNVMEYGARTMFTRNPALFYSLDTVAGYYGSNIFKMQAWYTYGLLLYAQQQPQTTTKERLLKGTH